MTLTCCAGIAGGLWMLCGCADTHRPPPPPPPFLPPAPSEATAVYHDHGIAFCYPAIWERAPAPTAVFRVVAPAADPADLNLDVPAVPAFFSAFVNPTLVGSHYADDVKRTEIPDAAVNFTDVQAPGGSGRDIKLVGHDKQGQPAIDEAIALVHAGRVYLFSTNTNDRGYPTARTALDAAIASVQWDP